jgi:hypothetical protein
MLGELYIKYDPNETTNVLIIDTDTNGAQLNCAATIFSKNVIGNCTEITTQIATIMSRLHNLMVGSAPMPIANVIIDKINYTVNFAIANESSSEVVDNNINITRPNSTYNASTLSIELATLCMAYDERNNLIITTKTGATCRDKYAKALDCSDAALDTLIIGTCTRMKLHSDEEQDLLDVLASIESSGKSYNSDNVAALKDITDDALDGFDYSEETIDSFAKSVAYNTLDINDTIKLNAPRNTDNPSNDLLAVLDKYQRIEQSTDALSSDEVEAILNCIMYYECGE